ncbi:MAG: extracellular solute-binding protein [Verrucomicrobia bacterium]|nr:extracellular solute-binding protein [Verrucomicrobiota bacterium]
MVVVLNAIGLMAEEPVILRLWTLPPISTENPVMASKARVYEAFRKAHPEIRLAAVSQLHVEGVASESSEYLAIAGGMAPDVYELYGRKLGDYVSQGFILPLETLLQKDPDYQTGLYTGIWSPHNIWEAAILPDAAGGNHLWGIPVWQYSMVLFYRSDILANQGLLRPPSNWEELYQWARACTWDPAREPGANPDDPRIFGMSLAIPQQGGWHLLQYIWSAHGDVLKPYAKTRNSSALTPWNRGQLPFEAFRIGISDQPRYDKKLARFKQEQEKVLQEGIEVDEKSPLRWQLAIDSEAGRAALNFQKRLVFSKWVRCQNRKDPRHLKEGVFLEFDVTDEQLRKDRVPCPVCGLAVNLDDKERTRRIYQGVVRRQEQGEDPFRDQFVMSIGTMQEVPRFPELAKVHLSPFPSVDGGETVSFTAGGYYCLNSGLQKDLRKLDAAWKFVKFMTDEKALRIRTETFVEMGVGSWVKPDLLLKFGFRDAYERQSPSLRDAMIRAAANTEVEPYAKGFYHIMVERFGAMLEKALASPDSDVDTIIRATVKECNERILGEPPASEMRKKERVGWVVILIGVAILLLGARKIIQWQFKEQGQSSPQESVEHDRGWGRIIRIWLFLLPAVIFILVWGYYPVARGTVMAFQDVLLLGGSKWVGIKHFVDVFFEPKFYQYLLQTGYYVLLSVCFGFVAPVALAVMLHEIPRGKVFFRTIYYLPHVTTGLVVMFLWKQVLYDPSPTGLLNQILHFFGIPPQRWLQDPSLAMICVVAPVVWAGVGANCLIYLAALKGIPDEYFEAADLDGAGPWHKLVHVMLPNLYALLIINLVGAVIGAFHASQNIFVMTGGGPQEATMTVGLDIWFKSFMYLNFGYATAEAWILGSLLIGFTLIQIRILNKIKFRKATG